MSRTMIVYYSRKGENYWNGSIKNLKKGNTQIAAEMIADITGGDLFEVETVKTYPKDYYQCIDEAKSELQKDDRPEVKVFANYLEDYDIIYVGYPNWWGTMPLVMFTFWEHYDLSGKRIIPFCTNEGSGMGRSERDLKKICKGAKIEKGLSIHGAEVSQSRSKIETWIRTMIV